MQKLVKNGYTLPEVLITVTLIALTLQIGMPALGRFQDKIRAEQEIAALRLIISSTREQAIYRRERVTLCPLVDGRCSKNWDIPLSLFNDNNNNQLLDPQEAVIKTMKASSKNVLRSFTGSVISFDPRGFAGIYTGSFGYCLSGNKLFSAAFIISRVGRIRRGSDSNNDGIYELAGERNVTCPPLP